MNLTAKIKDEFGTLKHFSKIAGINVESLSVIIYGNAKSKPVVDALIKYGFISKASDLKQYQVDLPDKKIAAINTATA